MNEKTLVSLKCGEKMENWRWCRENGIVWFGAMKYGWDVSLCVCVACHQCCKAVCLLCKSLLGYSPFSQIYWVTVMKMMMMMMIMKGSVCSRGHSLVCTMCERACACAWSPWCVCGWVQNANRWFKIQVVHIIWLEGIPGCCKSFRYTTLIWINQRASWLDDVTAALHMVCFH